MKLYTDKSGKFQMLIPIQWEYKNTSFIKNENSPNAFGQYDGMIGAFQLSCKPVTEHIANLIKTKNLPTQSSDSILKFSEDKFEDKTICSYMWSCAVDDHFIFITYILDPKISKRKPAIKELEDVSKTIANIKFIKPQYRDIVLTQRRYSLFMSSMATAIDLRNKAIKNRSFIEFVVLTANRIDGMLRLAIILANQLEGNHSEIDPSIIFQDDQDKPIMERKIYQIVLDRNIIDQNTFDKLELLYKERNKVIHRYIITDIRTADVVRIAQEYQTVEETVDKIVNGLEMQQYKSKVGINNGEAAPGERLVGDELQTLQTRIRDKHGGVKWE
jgi:hypothetical protein